MCGKSRSGLFGVYKGLGSADSDPVLRLIFDGRKTNAHFTECPPVRLPHPCRLAELELQEDEVLVEAAKRLVQLA
jgi:hypothetical protein